MKFLTLLIGLVLLWFASTKAQSQVSSDSVSVVARDSTLVQGVSDSLKREVFSPYDFQAHTLLPPSPSTFFVTDSVLRWQLNPSLEFFMERNPEVLMMRTGTLSHPFQWWHRGVHSDELSLYMDGWKVQNLIGQRSLMENIPWLRLRSLGQEGNIMEGNTRAYYLKKPLTRLYIDQTEFAFRSIMGQLAASISPKWHYELSYWNRSTEGEFQRTDVKSRQMNATVRYHPNNSSVVEAQIVYNGTEREEPLGFTTVPMEVFSFNRFDVQPDLVNAQSRARYWDSHLSWKIHPDSMTAVHLGLKRTTQRRSFSSGGSSLSSTFIDTTLVEGVDYRFLLHLRKQFTSKVSFSGSIEPGITSIQESRTLRGVSFLASHYLGLVTYKMNSNLETSLTSEGNWARFGGRRYLALQAHWILGKLGIHPKLSLHRLEPSVLNSLAISDTWNINLPTATHLSAGVSASLPLGRFELSGGSHLTVFQSPFGLTRQGYSPLAPMQHIQSDLGLSWEGEQFSAFTGVTMINQQTGVGEVTGVPNQWAGWSRTRIEWKDYILSRAAYAQLRIEGILSPFSYSTPVYHPAVDEFIVASENDPIPAFHRLDIEWAMRVRWMIVFVRGENLTQGWAQNGYFQTSGIPMHQRRFRYGFKIIFRD